LEESYNDLIAAPAPNNEKTNSSHGEVFNKLSKNFPKKTPSNTVTDIVIPIFEIWAKERNVSLFFGLPLL